MKPLRLLASTLLATAAFAAHAATITPGVIERPEGKRLFLLAQPPQRPDGKLPLVIILHGHGGSANMVFGRASIADPAAGWLDIADREPLLAIAPDGWKGSDDKRGWNDCRADATTNPPTDDIGFLSALIDKAVADFGADPARVYIVGMSNGGGMVYRAAIELAPRLAAAAALSALMPAHSLCAAPSHPIPMLIAHGTADKVVPYAGGEVGHWMLKGRGQVVGVEHAVKLWRELDGLPAAPVATVLRHRDPSDDTSATRYVWGGDPARMQVEFLKIEHGGHIEPSIAHRMSRIWTMLLGAQNGDVEFSDEAWSFFKNKRLAAAPPAAR